MIFAEKISQIARFCHTQEQHAPKFCGENLRK